MRFDWKKNPFDVDRGGVDDGGVGIVVGKTRQQLTSSDSDKPTGDNLLGLSRAISNDGHGDLMDGAIRGNVCRLIYTLANAAEHRADVAFMNCLSSWPCGLFVLVHIACPCGIPLQLVRCTYGVSSEILRTLGR